MLRKNAWVGMLFLVVFLPATLFAQEMMHGKWWQDESIVRELELTDSEKEVLNDKFIKSRRKMIDLKSEIEKHRFELELLLDDKDVENEKIMERYDSLEQTRKQLSKQRFEMLLEVRETLGAERFQELKSMHRARDRKNYKRSMKGRPSSRERDDD